MLIRELFNHNKLNKFFMAFTLPMVQDKASSPFQVTPALKSKGKKKGKKEKRNREKKNQQSKGQLVDPAKLQQGIAENQQEILQTPAAKRRNRDAEDPFKNGFFKTREQRREIEQKNSSVPMTVYKGKEEPSQQAEQTPAQKLFAPAKPKEQPNDPAAMADYRARMDKHRQAAAPPQKQKSFNQGALTDQEYADMEAKAAMAKNRASSVALPDPSRYQKALAAASGAQDTAGKQSGNDVKTNIFGGMQGFEIGQASSQAAGQSMDELAQAAADWERQNAQFDQNISQLPTSIPRGSALPQTNVAQAQATPPAAPRTVLPDMNKLKNLAAQEQQDRASSPWQDFKDAAVDKTASFIYGAGQLGDKATDWTNSLFNPNAVSQSNLTPDVINPPAVRALKKAQYDQQRFNLPQVPQPKVGGRPQGKYTVELPANR